MNTATPLSGTAGQKPNGIDQRQASGTQTEADELWYALDSAAKATHAQRKIAEGFERKAAAIRRSLGDDNATGTVTPTDDHLTFFRQGTMSAADFVAQDLPEKPWIVDGMIPSGALGVLLAAEKTGKSLFALDAGDAISRGVEFFGRSTTRTNVLVVEQEGAPYALKARLGRSAAPMRPTTLPSAIASPWISPTPSI